MQFLSVIFFVLFWVTSLGKCDDPKDITRRLESHLATYVPTLPKAVYLGDVSVRNVVMRDAYLGDLSSLKLINRAWIWRKFIWFSVFGDLKLDNMYLTARHFTIDGKNHTGKIMIGENAIHFHWEALDHFKCSILRERIDWQPLRQFYLQEDKTKTELIFSDEEVFNLKKTLSADEFLNQIRNILLPCLHPKYPITYKWEEDMKSDLDS